MMIRLLTRLGGIVPTGMRTAHDMFLLFVACQTDQLVASRGRVFYGCWFSTFTVRFLRYPLWNAYASRRIPYILAFPFSTFFSGLHYAAPWISRQFGEVGRVRNGHYE